MNLEEIAAEAEKIYREGYKEEYEREYSGQFVVIDIRDGGAYRHDTPEGAYLVARKASPHGIFHLMKIGSRGAFTGGSWPAMTDKRITLEA